MSTEVPAFTPADLPPDVHIAIAAARFNPKLVEALLDGATRRLDELSVPREHVEIVRVPGAFELPLAAQALAQTGRFAAIICLGAVVRGETPHFDYVAGECARGISDVSRQEELPVIFGVLTTNNEDQAWDRAGGKHGHAGVRAAEAALEMVALMARIKRGN